MAPNELENVEQETAATGDPDQGEHHKNNEVDFDIQSSDDEGNSQFVDTRAAFALSNNIASGTTMSPSRAIVDNTITINTTSDIVLPMRAAATEKAASAESTSETTTIIEATH